MVGLVVAVAAQLGIKGVGKAARSSLKDTDWTTRLTSNFVAYFVTGLSSLVIALLLIIPEAEQTSID